jgi:predicted deacylase
MKQPFAVGNVRAAPGSVAHGYLFSAEVRDGSSVGVPVIVVNGSEDGPVLSIVAGTHPNEQAPMEAIRRLTREILSPKQVKGALVAVPCANPLAFQHGEYVSPNDGVNIYLAYPGDKQGSITQRFAAAIWENVGLKSNCVIDFHSNYQPCLMFSYLSIIKDKTTLKKAHSLAKAGGLTVIFADDQLYPSSGFHGFTDLLLEHGVPGFTFEVAGSNDIVPVSVNVTVRGLQNVMKAMEMLPGNLEPHKEIKVLTGDYCFYGMVKANRAGLVQKIAEPGAKLKKGDVIARIHNLFGEEVEVITAPTDGYIWSYPLRTPRALPTQAVECGSNISYFFVDYKKEF